MPFFCLFIDLASVFCSHCHHRSELCLERAHFFPPPPDMRGKTRAGLPLDLSISRSFYALFILFCPTPKSDFLETYQLLFSHEPARGMVVGIRLWFASSV